jgi:hypothetical protein
MSRDPSLRRRLAEVGRSLAAREAEHAAALDEARREAVALHRVVAGGLEAYHEATGDAPQLRVELGPVRPDDKHVRSVEFDLVRGRMRAIVTVKSRGEVTLVGPFKAGGTEGPCKSFPFDAREELDKALGEFLESFLQAAATP